VANYDGQDRPELRDSELTVADSFAPERVRVGPRRVENVREIWNSPFIVVDLTCRECDTLLGKQLVSLEESYRNNCNEDDRKYYKFWSSRSLLWTQNCLTFSL